MCCVRFLLILALVTILRCQADDSRPDIDLDQYDKRHVSTLARDGLLNGKRYVSSLIKNVRPITITNPNRDKKFAHPYRVFMKPSTPIHKKYIGSVLSKAGPVRFYGDKRNLVDGMVFGEDMRQYLLGRGADKRSYGVDGLVFGEDLRRLYQDDANEKRSVPYPLLKSGGKRMYAMDGLVYGEDLRRLLQNPQNENKRGYDSFMDGMVFGDDLRNKVLQESYGKRGLSLMDGMVFGEDLRPDSMNSYDKRSHGLMDGMVFAEDLRKAIQEASVRKDKEKHLQKLKDADKDMELKYSKSLMKSGGSGKRSVQALAKNGYLKSIDSGKRAGIEALARNGLLKGSLNQGKRAGLEALARNGYLNKCQQNSNKRGLSVLAKNGIIPLKMGQNPKRDSLDEDSWSMNPKSDDLSGVEHQMFPSYGKRPFLGHRPASATTRNIPFIQEDVLSSDKKNSYVPDYSDEVPYEQTLQKKYVATLLKEAGSPAKINIRNVQKSVDEDSETEEEESETQEQNGNKRDDYDDEGVEDEEENSLNDEYSMPVMQHSSINAKIGHLTKAISDLYRLDEEGEDDNVIDNEKRYYAVKGGGRILGGRLQEIGKQKQSQGHQRSWI